MPSTSSLLDRRRGTPAPLPPASPPRRRRSSPAMRATANTPAPTMATAPTAAATILRRADLARRRRRAARRDAAVGARQGQGVARCRRRSRSFVLHQRSERRHSNDRSRLPTPPADVRVAVTGSHGLIGTALLDRLAAAGHEAVRIVRGRRRRRARSAGTRRAGRLDPAALAGVDAVVNLAGAGIGDQRWTDDYKRQVRESRTVGDDDCSPRRSPRPTTGRGCCCRARPSGSTATAATSSSTRRRRRATASSPTSPGTWEAATAAAEAAGRAGRPPAHRHRAGRRAGRWRRCCRCSSSASAAASARAGSG